MSLMRVGLKRRKTRGTIQERVSRELARAAAERAERERCTHRFLSSPNVRGAICIDCGLRQ